MQKWLIVAFGHVACALMEVTPMLTERGLTRREAEAVGEGLGDRVRVTLPPRAFVVREVALVVHGSLALQQRRDRLGVPMLGSEGDGGDAKVIGKIGSRPASQQNADRLCVPP